MFTFQGTGETATNGPEWHGAFLLLWHLDGTLVYSMAWPGDFPALNLAFSPDGTRLAVATTWAARVYNVADGAMLAERKYTNGVF
jgi:sugar lactone lactonase YvrE